MATLFCPTSTSYSIKLMTSGGSYFNPPFASPNLTLEPSPSMRPNQVRRNPYPPVSNPTTSVLRNPRRPRVQNHYSSRFPTYAHVEAILRSRFPTSEPWVIASAAGECTEFFESNNIVQRVSRPAHSLSTSHTEEIVYDGFLRRKSQTYPLF
jgi:hypothetical protein